MRNQEIREAIRASGLKMWEVAEAYGISDCNFSRRLRYEFSESEKSTILNIITELASAHRTSHEK